MSDAKALFVLHESAAGYALFEVVAFEEIGALLEGAMDTVTNLDSFSRAVKLKAFQPFESAEDALLSINAVSEHSCTDGLHAFLEMNLPKIKKKKEGKPPAFALGVIDPALATAIADGMPGLSCRSDETVREVLRGCRLHMTHFVKGLAGGSQEQAQLGLGHSYSRGKVKFNPARSDNMIIQSIALLDQMDKDLNTFAMRVREWYSWHFPELKDLVKDNYMYARCAAFIQDKRSLCAGGETKGGESFSEGGDESGDGPEDKLAGLVEIIGDEDVANAVVSAARTSMGMDCSAIDMVNIVNFTQRMVKLAEFRKQLASYLTDKMSVVAPNLSALIGDTVAARLISKAGSLTNLAKAPASTVQILGAEKALFRALKTKGNTPKYGLIYHSTFIGRADAKNKGRISRYLANKCSIATRIDSFADEPSNLYGQKLRDQVEERLKFYETGAAPRKNIDVMEEVARHLKAGQDAMDEDEGAKKKKKKDKKTPKKRKADSDEDDEEDEKAAKKSAKKAKKEALKTPEKSAEEPTPSKEKSSKKSSKKEKKKKKSKA
jgi:nucleolar protein 56